MPFLLLLVANRNLRVYRAVVTRVVFKRSYYALFAQRA